MAIALDQILFLKKENAFSPQRLLFVCRRMNARNKQ